MPEQQTSRFAGGAAAAEEIAAAAGVWTRRSLEDRQ